MLPLTIDLFAGGGGASKGFALALGREPDVAVNHNPVALAIHAANHPATAHYIQDVWSVQPLQVTRGWPVGALWASPDCTHFSKAKGSAPTRDAKIRDLAWVVVKWARQVRPDRIFLENVEEFISWGPLDAKGRVIGIVKRPRQATLDGHQPEPEVVDLRGSLFRAFVGALRRLGYAVQWRELRACGNSVCPDVAAALIRANCPDLATAIDATNVRKGGYGDV